MLINATLIYNSFNILTEELLHSHFLEHKPNAT